MISISKAFATRQWLWKHAGAAASRGGSLRCGDIEPACEPEIKRTRNEKKTPVLELRILEVVL
jgi:hypothetical protein